MARGRSGDGAGPSAHPISQPNSEPATPAVGAEAEGNKLPGVAGEDASLYLDLLRKARGDTELAGRWLAQISSSAPSAASGGPSSSPPRGASDGGGIDLDAAAAAAGAPASFFCPISLKLMRDPVTLSTGQSYDRKFIARWLASGNTTCPATNAALERPVRQVPNVALRQAIESWAETHALWLLGSDGHIKPIPAGDDFSLPSSAPASDASVDVALRLQREALERHAASNRSGRAESRPSAPPLGQGLGFGTGTGVGGVASCQQRRQQPPPPPLPPPSYDFGGYPPNFPRPMPPPAVSHPPPPPPAPRPCDGFLNVLNSPRLLSLLIYLSSGATFALFVVSLWKNGWEVSRLRVNPLVGASPDVLKNLGAKDGSSIIDGGQWWRLFSSAFLCAGAVDVAVVSSLVWTLGYRTVARSVVAPVLSVPLIYLSSSVFGGLVSTNFLPRAPTPSVGAPAGCAGLLGAAVAFQLLHWRRFSRRLGTALALLGVAGVLAALAVLPLDDCFYLGGAAAFGVVAAPAHSDRARRRRNDGATTTAASSFLSSLVRLLLFSSLAGAIAAGVVGITKSKGSWGERVCGDRCSRAACVETRWWSCDGIAGPPPPPPSTGATPACTATVEGDSTKVSCPSASGGGKETTTRTLQGKRETSGPGLLSVCREACLGESPSPPPKVTPVPAKDGAAADPSKGVLI